MSVPSPRTMGPTLSPETSAFKLQTPGKFPEEYKLHSEHGESLKTTVPGLFLWVKRSECQTGPQLPYGAGVMFGAEPLPIYTVMAWTRKTFSLTSKLWWHISGCDKVEPTAWSSPCDSLLNFTNCHFILITHFKRPCPENFILTFRRRASCPLYRTCVSLLSRERFLCI